MNALVSGIVRTVLGDRDPSTLGVIDYHEHLFQVSPLLVGDELDDDAMSGTEGALLRSAGVNTMVEATPLGLGGRPSSVHKISAATGLDVVHATGAHHGGHYPDGHPLRDLDVAALTRRFVRDVTVGFEVADASLSQGAPVRAGLVKAGARYWAIGPFERRVLEAAAATSRQTGCAVMVHLDHGSATHEVLDLLQSEGVAAERVVLAHIDRNLDPGLHADLAERGAYLGFDGMARHAQSPDSAILDCILTAIGTGSGAAARRVVLGGDVARRSRYIAYGGMPGLAYLPERFLPRLSAMVSEEVYTALAGGNAARWLTMPADNG